MWFFKKYIVADHERGLLFRNNSFEKVLAPGRYFMPDLKNEVQVEKHDISQPKFQHRLARFLLRTYPELKANYFNEFELGDSEVGLSYIDGKLSDILPPGTYHSYWKNPATVEVKIIDISHEFEVSDDLLAVLTHSDYFRAAQATLHYIHYSEIADNFVGLLTVNGQKTRLLEPGYYGFWRYNRNIGVKLMDMRLQSMEVSGQEMLSKDRVSLRLNVSAGYRVVDPEKAAMQVADYANFLYSALQLAVREAVGAKTLDELLVDKNVLNQVIFETVAKKAVNYSLEIESVGVKDVILPGEMKTILNQVVEAEKAAEANLIKRREETAATRSLHNTAKVMEGNPTLMRLKELEVLEKVTDRIDNITVYGGLEGVLKNLVTIPATIDASKG